MHDGVQVMVKIKAKLTKEEKKTKKKAKEERQKKYMWVFMNGRQVKIRRPLMVEGVELKEFIRCNADPVWLQQEEMWEYL